MLVPSWNEECATLDQPIASLVKDYFNHSNEKERNYKADRWIPKMLF